MLIPSPTSGDIKTLIGDKNIDEISDLSDTCDDDNDYPIEFETVQKIYTSTFNIAPKNKEEFQSNEQQSSENIEQIDISFQNSENDNILSSFDDVNKQVDVDEELFDSIVEINGNQDNFIDNVDEQFEQILTETDSVEKAGYFLQS